MPYPGYHRTFVAPVSGSATGGVPGGVVALSGLPPHLRSPGKRQRHRGVPGCGCALSGLPPHLRSPGKRQRHRGCSRMRLRLIRATTALRSPGKRQRHRGCSGCALFRLFNLGDKRREIPGAACTNIAAHTGGGFAALGERFTVPHPLSGCPAITNATTALPQ